LTGGWRCWTLGSAMLDTEKDDGAGEYGAEVKSCDMRRASNMRPPGRDAVGEDLRARRRGRQGRGSLLARRPRRCWQPN
jgi:hypothetical protein